MKVEFKRTFLKELQKINAPDQKYILKKIEAFIKKEENLDIKKMEPKEESFFRLRVGKYRLIFQYLSKTKVVFLKVDKRDSVYFGF